MELRIGIIGTGFTGGQIHEQTIHLYDLARFFCGDAVAASGLQANLLHQNSPGYTIEDTSVGTVRFANGALASITGSNCAIPMHFFADYRLVCEKGTLEYRCSGQPWVQADEAVFYPIEGEAETITQERDCFLEENRHFIQCLQSGKPTSCPAVNGLRAIEIVESVLEPTK